MNYVPNPPVNNSHDLPRREISMEEFRTREALAREIFIHTMSDASHAYSTQAAEQAFAKAEAFIAESARQQRLQKIW